MRGCGVHSCVNICCSSDELDLIRSGKAMLSYPQLTPTPTPATLGPCANGPPGALGCPACTATVLIRLPKSAGAGAEGLGKQGRMRMALGHLECHSKHHGKVPTDGEHLRGGSLGHAWLAASGPTMAFNLLCRPLHLHC